MIDCACCGLAIGREDNSYMENDEYECPECDATCVVFVGDDGAYFGAWRCKHGEDGDEWCYECAKESEGP